MVRHTLMFIVLLAQSCGSQPETKNKFPNQKEINESMVPVNKQFAQDERAMIEAYIVRHGLKMHRSGTGLYYSIDSIGHGALVQTGNKVEVNYQVKLLNGNLLYSSEETGARSFIVEGDNIESGLHEGVQLMREGDRAMFILPSHRAHGLSGDNDKIPPRSTVVYHVELLKVK